MRGGNEKRGNENTGWTGAMTRISSLGAKEVGEASTTRRGKGYTRLFRLGGKKIEIAGGRWQRATRTREEEKLASLSSLVGQSWSKKKEEITEYSLKSPQTNFWLIPMKFK